MRNVAAVLAVAGLVSAVAAQPLAETYRSKNGRFSVALPGQPKETSQTTKSAVGDLKVNTATYATPEGNVFMVTYTDFPAAAIKPENQGTLLDGVVEGLKGKDGKVVSDKEITLGADKLHGREVMIDKGKNQIRFRIVVKDTRLYQVAVLGAGEFVTGKDGTAFLDSFELTK